MQASLSSSALRRRTLSLKYPGLFAALSRAVPIGLPTSDVYLIARPWNDPDTPF